MTKKISLVLGSGGARGLAHIGVVNWLEQNGYRIHSIVGCSMGAMVGGIYAMGKLDKFEEWVRAIRKRDILALLDVTFRRSGLVKGDRLFNALKQLTGEKHIEDLPISFTAVATDINRFREVWINEGPVFDAIRASCSLPLLFTPVLDGDRKLIDGGVLNPVPIAPTSVDTTEMTIAINVSGEVKDGLPHSTIAAQSDQNRSAMRGKIEKYMESLSASLMPEKSVEGTMSDVIYQSYDAMQSTIARQKLSAYPPDVLIDIPRNVCNIMEFHRADELIRAGYEATAVSMRQHQDITA